MLIMTMQCIIAFADKIVLNLLMLVKEKVVKSV